MNDEQSDLRKRIKWSGLANQINALRFKMENIDYPNFGTLRDDQIEELINSFEKFKNKVDKLCSDLATFGLH